MDNSRKRNFNDHLCRNSVIIGITILCITGVFTSLDITVTGTSNDIVWDVTIEFIETGGKYNYVVFGEAADANDGSTADSYDSPKSPLPPSPPYLRVWFDDDLPSPYNTLWKDYRKHPDTSKVWDLYVRWVPSDDVSPTDITVSWSISEIISSEYASIELFDYDNNIVIAEMTHDNTYEYVGLANENHHFQIRATTDNGDNGGNGGNGGQPPVNTPPVANASASETFGFVGMYINFNGSNSYDADEDGYIESWEWDFGDGETGTGETTEHIYFEAGFYNITLTVTDNNGATDTDTINVTIVKGNNPPTQPEVTGPDTGHKNISYEYTANSTDIDNDTISYIFKWGDGEINTTEFLPIGTMATRIHTWTAAGRYTIKVQATDNQTYSQTTELIVMIDAIYVGDIGYLTDDDGDETYDTFHNNATGNMTDLRQDEDGNYLIDNNGDGEWDYIFNQTSGAITPFTEEETRGGNPWPFIALIASALAVIAVIVYFYKKNYF